MSYYALQNWCLSNQLSTLEKRCKELEIENKLLKEYKSKLFGDIKNVLSNITSGPNGSYYYSSSSTNIVPISQDGSDVADFVNPFNGEDNLSAIALPLKEVRDLLHHLNKSIHTFAVYCNDCSEEFKETSSWLNEVAATLVNKHPAV